MPQERRRENWQTTFAGKTSWTKPMLERLLELDSQGLSEREMLPELQSEFGAPKYIGEIVTELRMLKRGPVARMWNSRMGQRLKDYTARRMDVNDITNELFDEFAKPESGYWQETYRKIQEMKLEGKIA